MDDDKLLEKYHWSNKCGFTNADTLETMCWRGKMQKGLPAERWFVHKGSKSYLTRLDHVPVIKPSDLCLVPKDVRDQSLKALCAELEVPADQAANSADAKQPPPQEPAQPDCTEMIGHIKKRRLCRQPTNVDEGWFPHDHAKYLEKELVWRAGGRDTVRWSFTARPLRGTASYAS